MCSRCRLSELIQNTPRRISKVLNGQSSRESDLQLKRAIPLLRQTPKMERLFSQDGTGVLGSTFWLEFVRNTGLEVLNFGVPSGLIGSSRSRPMNGLLPARRVPSINWPSGLNPISRDNDRPQVGGLTPLTRGGWRKLAFPLAFELDEKKHFAHLAPMLSRLPTGLHEASENRTQQKSPSEAT